jgi:hypothetical protein
MLMLVINVVILNCNLFHISDFLAQLPFALYITPIVEISNFADDISVLKYKYSFIHSFMQ